MSLTTNSFSAFDDVDIPDLILALILIGLDPSTKPVVLQEIKSTVEHICSNIADEQSEERVADRISEVCKNFEPINKAYVVSFFMRASPTSTRIVRWVARSLLLVPEGLSVVSCCLLRHALVMAYAYFYRILSGILHITSIPQTVH